MDPLTDALRVAAVRGSVSTTVLAAEPWGLVLPQAPVAAFHAVTAGTVHVEVDGHPPLRLAAGDAVLLPRGAPHRLRSAPGAPVEEFDPALAQAALESGRPMVLGTGTPVTRVLCAKYASVPARGASPFLHLPEVLHVPAAAADEGLRATLALLSTEVAAAGVGKRVVLDHVVSVLLVQLLRQHLAAGPALPPSWLRGLTDPVTSAALQAVHDDPARGWTATALGREVGVSAATLTRRFAAHVGCGPAEYVARWRLELAAQRLREGDEPVGAVARAVGYTSEYAFNRAFRRHHGEPPGRYRRAAA